MNALQLRMLIFDHKKMAQRWHNEDYERPIDQEGSGDDDSFEDEEIEETDEIYSGSGSGYFEQESRIKTAVQLTTDPSVGLSTTPAVLPVTSVQPVATPFAPFPAEETTYDPATSDLYVTKVTEAPAVTIWKAVTTTAGTTIHDTTTTTMATTTTASTTTAASKTTTVLRVLPPFITIVATTQVVTLETPIVATAAPNTESTAAPLVTTSLTKIRGMPKPSPSQHPDITLPPPTTTVAPSESTQTEPPDVTLSTALNNELEVPVSGDFEIHEEEDTTRTELGNEVVALVTPAAGPGLKKNAEPGLIDNTIDSGNSAAQLPQKNILERKEVLIAVIVGGVVGALFAAFLVMLLIYRMKKKDEGSYTLEEPKQASVTYQKPDKQEEFYA
ncbi:PREDICTED: syndecan-3 [Gekko japonicus]|uniref:Syndecan n=1 Tax=Gekko japonicus TaxID=146911 RepID=A0ABM1KYS6_GEKJA|nr:PREDICTED: syndecan-3 [Gekko japonicus]